MPPPRRVHPLPWLHTNAGRLFMRPTLSTTKMTVETPGFAIDAIYPTDSSTMATTDYTVVMTVVSIRFSDEPLHRRLKDSAHQRSIGVSTLAERLIDEGLRMEAHPSIVFERACRAADPSWLGGPRLRT